MWRNSPPVVPLLGWCIRAGRREVAGTGRGCRAAPPGREGGESGEGGAEGRGEEVAAGGAAEDGTGQGKGARSQDATSCAGKSACWALRPADIILLLSLGIPPFTRPPPTPPSNLCRMRAVERLTEGEWSLKNNLLFSQKGSVTHSIPLTHTSVSPLTD